jgi:hypothetical protein
MIGKQAEFCFEYYLKHSHRYKLLAANIQIKGETETLGEIDYLVFDTERQQMLHVELACKFYLHDSGLNDMDLSQWIGPNRKDTLKEKLDKLHLKQFPLIKRAETQDTLKKLNIDPDTIEQQLCLKAFLFIRKGWSANQFSDSYRSCLVGYWIPFSEFITEDNTALYSIPKKKEWLLPLEQTKEYNSFSETQAILKLNIDIKRSVLIYKKQKTAITRIFVVWW